MQDKQAKHCSPTGSTKLEQRRRNRAGLVSISTLLALSCCSLMQVAPASADETYKLPPNAISKMFRAGPCLYRVWDGTYGSGPAQRPFAYLRVYTSSCAYDNEIAVWHTKDAKSFYPTPVDRRVREGTDSCGKYWEIGGAHGFFGFGVGARVAITEAGVINEFFHDKGAQTSGYGC